ncbi:nitrite/sulfite reductase [Commensalibacter oyaizuii]|uniref:Nitrite/sulfite reductase n=1 Tax=Commensalibacter oyaizuii TaxID=3043873 RepID=A0ABT6Q2F1_9PROT|nr:nitrite/sulfite reductase [Commensalibacter sp. TBRC 16381]MDI2091268.1 nitrite/sulfite reductase [Commensalibacter sp. TBRC 16381]
MNNHPTSSPTSLAVGRYNYDQLDHNFLKERINQFRSQIQRRLSGELSEDEFKPLRLMNGVYLQLHSYMLRVAIPYGILSSTMLRGLAYVSQYYDRGYGHFTTRQNIQFHWTKLEEVPDILTHLASVEMHALQTSGNCIRNITSDEFAGLAEDEILDPRIYAEVMRQWSTLHPEFTFLPRKFKIAISGSSNDRVAACFYDIGILTRLNEQNKPVFEVWVGGGLGRIPYQGKVIRDDLPPEHLLAYIEAIIRVYNLHGIRNNLYKARIKILVENLGIDAYREQVEKEFASMDLDQYRLSDDIMSQIQKRFGRPTLADYPNASATLENQRKQDKAFDRWVKNNTHPHFHKDYIAAVIALKEVGKTPGDITTEQMYALADLADQFAFGEIRVTHLQNVVLGHIRKDQLYALWQELKKYKLATPNIGLITDIVCCPGMDYCALANARSIPVAKQIAALFEDIELQEKIGPINIGVDGCINSCAHHHIMNIGVLGVDKKGEEFYQIKLGGSSYKEGASIGSILGASVTADEAIAAVKKLIDFYLEQRQDNEHFIDTYRRLGTAPFKEIVYATA